MSLLLIIKIGNDVSQGICMIRSSRGKTREDRVTYSRKIFIGREAK